MTRRTLPWLDHSGRLSPLKLAVFLALFCPGIWTAAAYWLDMLGPRPLNEAIHQYGLWTVRFLGLTLAITPLRQALQWPRLILVRRMIGVAAFCYISIHLSLYIADQQFDLGKVASEIVLRIYLTIGFTAVLGTALLAATSTDGMQRRLGGKAWQRLHRIVYGIAVLAIIHYFMQAKLEVFEPTVAAGLLGWLMFYRLIAWSRRDRRVPYWAFALIGPAAAAATAVGEALYFWLKMGAPLGLVLAADLSTETGIRPAWYVFGITAAITIAVGLRLAFRREEKLRLKPA